LHAKSKAYLSTKENKKRSSMFPKVSATRISSSKKNDDYYLIPVGDPACQQRRPASAGAATLASVRGNMHRAFFLGYGDNAGAGANTQAGTDEMPTAPPPPGVNPQFSVENLAAGPNAAAASSGAEEGTSEEDWTKDIDGDEPFKEDHCINHTTSKIYWVNAGAVLMHAGLAVLVFVLGNSKSPKMWRLKQDRTYAAPERLAPKTNPFVKVCAYYMLCNATN
jgi:hypothetical protein